MGLLSRRRERLNKKSHRGEAIMFMHRVVAMAAAVMLALLSPAAGQAPPNAGWHVDLPNGTEHWLHPRLANR
jgi:hypothetical protein